MTSVAVLTVTGSLAGLREVGGWSALTGTGYGRLLLVKLLLFAVVLAIASRARAWVQRHTTSARVPEAQQVPVRSLRTSVLAETGIGAIVLAVTAVMVATTPAVSAAVPGEQVVRGDLPDGTVAGVAVDGTRLLSIRLQTRAGELVKPLEVSAVASLPARGVVDLPVQLHAAGETWAAHEDPLPFPGAWRIIVTVRTSELDAGVTTVTVPVP